MTDEQAKKFFDKVKGKKIAWATCPDDYYFIPSSYEKLGNSSYVLYGVDMNGNDDTWYMCNGDDWRFFSDSEKNLIEVEIKISGSYVKWIQKEYYAQENFKAMFF